MYIHFLKMKILHHEIKSGDAKLITLINDKEHMDITCVTVWVKTSQVHPQTEINFIASAYSYTI